MCKLFRISNFAFIAAALAIAGLCGAAHGQSLFWQPGAKSAANGNANPGTVSGNPNWAVSDSSSNGGQPTIQLDLPADTTKGALLRAGTTVIGSGIKAGFTGSSATASYAFSGSYMVTGFVPSANGTLSVSGSYLQYAGALGAFYVAGSSTSTLAAAVNVAPFPVVNPQPNPASITANPGIGISRAGAVAYVATPAANVNANPIANGFYSVNISATVTASRTGGFTQAAADYGSLNPTWTLTPNPPVKPVPVAANGNGNFNNGLVSNNPINHFGTLATFASTYKPDYLTLDSSNNLFWASVDPASVADPDALAVTSPNILLGNASGLGYLGGVRQSPTGQTIALQTLAFSNQNFDTTQAKLMTVNLTTGSTSPVSLSRPLVMPSSLALGQGDFASHTLVTELGSHASAQLDSIDAAGNVAVINNHLTPAGAPNPLDMQFTPATGWGTPNDLLILNAGTNGSLTLTNGTGSIIRVDQSNPSLTSPFLTGLSAPVAMEFGSGALIGHPLQQYLYVLQMGDQDQSTGLLTGNGSLVAYDSLGNPTDLVDNITDPKSLIFSADGSTLYFTSGNNILSLVPEPGSFCLIAVAAAGACSRPSSRRRGQRS